MARAVDDVVNVCMYVILANFRFDTYIANLRLLIWSTSQPKSGYSSRRDQA